MEDRSAVIIGINCGQRLTSEISFMSENNNITISQAEMTATTILDPDCWVSQAWHKFDYSFIQIIHFILAATSTDLGTRRSSGSRLTCIMTAWFWSTLYGIYWLSALERWSVVSGSHMRRSLPSLLRRTSSRWLKMISNQHRPVKNQWTWDGVKNWIRDLSGLACAI